MSKGPRGEKRPADVIDAAVSIKDAFPNVRSGCSLQGRPEG